MMKRHMIAVLSFIVLSHGQSLLSNEPQPVQEPLEKTPTVHQEFSLLEKAYLALKAGGAGLASGVSGASVLLAAYVTSSTILSTPELNKRILKSAGGASLIFALAIAARDTYKISSESFKALLASLL